MMWNEKDLLTLVYFLIFFIPALGYFTKCPSCGKFFKRRKNGERECIGYKDSQIDVEREDKVYRDSKGNKIGSSFVKEKKEVTFFTYKYFWKCSKCNHEWVTTKIES